MAHFILSYLNETCGGCCAFDLWVFCVLASILCMYIVRFYIVLFSALEHIHCAGMRFYMSEQLFIVCFWISTEVVNVWIFLWMSVWLWMLSTLCPIPCVCIFYLTCDNKYILIDWLRCTHILNSAKRNTHTLWLKNNHQYPQHVEELQQGSRHEETDKILQVDLRTNLLMHTQKCFWNYALHLRKNWMLPKLDLWPLCACQIIKTHASVLSNLF